MIWIGRGAGALVFLFSLLLGAAALIVPDRAALQLGFVPLSEMGRNSVRADIVALAWTSAILCAGGLFVGRGRWFLGAATIFGIAVSGRILDVIVSGPPDGVAQPIIIELILVACALIAARLLPSK